MIKRLLAMAAALQLVVTGVAARGEDSLRDQIDRLARPLVEQEVVVGMSIGVIRGDERQVFGYGRISPDNDRVPDGDTVYEIGSTTKVYTAVLLAEMAERGEVKPDDPLAACLPDAVVVPEHPAGPITLEHLATHSSGLPRLPDNMRPANPLNPYADYSVAQMYAFLSGHELRRAPGKLVAYSNLGMGLLGHVLAHRAGVSYEDMVIERIARPLGMGDTAIALGESMRRRLAPGHFADGRPAPNWDLPTLAGAGALRSTVHDQLRFLAANLDPPDSSLGRALRAAHARRYDTPEGWGVGLGWHIARDGVTRWHNGQTGGYHAMMMFSPSARAAVVVLANTAAPEVDPLGERIMRTLYGQAVQPVRVAEEARVDPRVLRQYVGVYRLAPGFELTVTLEADRLMVQATGQAKLPVYAASETEFFYRVVEARLTFERDEAGRATRVILHQNGRDMPAMRVE